MSELKQQQIQNERRYQSRPVVSDRSMPKPTHSGNPLLTQQPALGNHAMQRFAQSCPLSLPSASICPFGGVCHACPVRVQAKLKISQPGDKYEQEADRVADEVMRMPDPRPVDRSPLNRAPMISHIQRQCSECEEELQRQPKKEADEELLQTKEMPGRNPEVNSSIETNINAVRSGGQPLPDSVREYFEPRFGCDFSQVRIHADSQATESARVVNAQAYTLGSDIVFGSGQYSPGTIEGRWLVAHELTHVVQQMGNLPSATVGQDLGNRSTLLSKCIPNVVGDVLHERVFSSVVQRQACFDSANITVSKAGLSHSCSAFTSPTAPTPIGQYCVRRQGAAQRQGGLRGIFQDRSSWYLLEPQFQTTRSRLHLHHGTQSTGCITVRDRNCFDQLAGVLNTGRGVMGFGYDGYPPGNTHRVHNHRREVYCVDMLTVTSTRGGCSLP